MELSPILVARETRCAGDPRIRRYRTAVQYMPQARCRRRERRHVRTDIGRHMHSGAGRSIIHPCWNLKPTIGIRPGQITAENNPIRLLDRCVDTDPKTKTRMPRVQQFPKLSSVGVSEPRCTTPRGRTRASTGSPQLSLLPALQKGHNQDRLSL